MKHNLMISVGLGLILLLALGGGLALARHGEAQPADVGSSFTFQGELIRDDAPLTAECDMAFQLYDAAEDGNQVGSTVNATVAVTDGLFTTQLDFGGNAFTGDARWLDLEVQCPGDAGSTDLGRYPLAAHPQTLYALTVPWGGLNVPADWSDGDNVDDTVSWGEISGIVGTGGNQVAFGDHQHDGRYYLETELESSGQAQVHWKNLSSPPADLDDGDSVDDTVSWSEISGITGSGSQQVAASSHMHGDRYYLQYEMQTEGMAQVHWDNLTSVPAGFADGVDNTGADYAQRIIVAQSGGDFGSIQAAINSITDATAEQPYLVWVAPGVYNESVRMKPYVHLQGAGQEATVISSTVYCSLDDPVEATLVLTHHVSLRDLTVENGGDMTRQVSIYAGVGTTQTVVMQVSAYTRGGEWTSSAVGVYIDGADTGLALHDLAVLVEGGVYATALSAGGKEIDVYGGSYNARGQNQSVGIRTGSLDHACTVRTFNTVALAEGGQQHNTGLQNAHTTVILTGGSFTGRGGDDAKGIVNAGPGYLEAYHVTGLAEEANDSNHGLWLAAQTQLLGGTFTGQGGSEATGIYLAGGNVVGVDLQAWDVTALGENGTVSAGLYNLPSNAYLDLVLHGGSFTGRDGSQAYGIYNRGNLQLEARGVRALAEEASSENVGLYSWSGADVVLFDGTFTGRGGDSAHGADNEGNGTSLTADGSSFFGTGGSSSTYGFFNLDSASATLSRVVLDGTSNALSRAGGTVMVSNSRLEGGAISGTVTCTLVTRNSSISTDGSTCP